MKPTTSPIFQSFLTLLTQHQIDGWTSNKIWKNLNLSKDKKEQINQQQLYRLLRKLMKQGYLVKHIHSDNPRLSTFVETESMCELREQFDLLTVKNDSKKLTLKINELKEKQKICENQIKASEQALIDFPELKSEILRKRKDLQKDLEQLEAYSSFINRLISNF